MNKTFAAFVAVCNDCRFARRDTRKRTARRRRRRGSRPDRRRDRRGAIASSRPAYGAPVYVEEEAPPACRLVRELLLGRLRLGLPPRRGLQLT